MKPSGTGIYKEEVLMATSDGFFEFIKEQLSGTEDITFRKMMGEYIIYYRERIVGGLYDDRLLVKPVRAASQLMPEAELQEPYESARKMLLVDNVDDREFLRELITAMYDELPEPKKKKKGTNKER